MVYNKNTEKAVEENKVGERKTNLGPKRNGCIRKQKVRQIEKEQTVRGKKKRRGVPREMSCPKVTASFSFEVCYSGKLVIIIFYSQLICFFLTNS